MTIDATNEIAIGGSATTPAESFSAATAAYVRASDDFQAADIELLAAISARDALLAQAAEGAAIGTSDVRQAEDLIRKYEAAAMLAKAIQTGMLRRMDAAEVRVMNQQAAQHYVGWPETIRAAVAEAVKFDSCVRASRDSLAKVYAALAAVELHRRQALVHDEHVAHRALENGALLAIQQAEWPLAGKRMRDADYRKDLRVEIVHLGHENSPWRNLLGEHLVSMFYDRVPTCVAAELREMLRAPAPTTDGPVDVGTDLAEKMAG
jgi:hypothetical protein